MYGGELIHPQSAAKLTIILDLSLSFYKKCNMEVTILTI